MRQILIVGMNCGRKESFLDGGRRKGIINDSCLLTCENGDVIKMCKSRSWEEKKTKVSGLQIYVQNVKVVVFTM